MTTPTRHQRKRILGYRLPAGTVCVSRPSRWGNPFPVGPLRPREVAVAAFREWLTTDNMALVRPKERRYILDHLHELRGKDLACWCPLDAPCHADVLMELANAPQ